jgi:Suppressor of fused protein (SUFU)
VGLPQHLEEFLGPIQGGWSQDADGRKVPFAVVDFAGGPRPGTATFSTLGLSKTPMHAQTEATHVYQELVIVVPRSLRVGPVPGILQEIGQEAIAKGEALLRGDVVGPRGPLFSDGSRMEAFYAAIPVCFPSEFATYREEDRDVVMVWLIPIHAVEAEFVRQRGWSQFEDELRKADPDLIDIERDPLFG